MKYFYYIYLSLLYHIFKFTESCFHLVRNEYNSFLQYDVKTRQMYMNVAYGSINHGKYLFTTGWALASIFVVYFQKKQKRDIVKHAKKEHVKYTE